MRLQNELVKPLPTRPLSSDSTSPNTQKLSPAIIPVLSELAFITGRVISLCIVFQVYLTVEDGRLEAAERVLAASQASSRPCSLH